MAESLPDGEGRVYFLDVQIPDYQCKGLNSFKWLCDILAEAHATIEPKEDGVVLPIYILRRDHNPPGLY